MVAPELTTDAASRPASRDMTYLPTIGYIIPEQGTTHTVLAAHGVHYRRPRGATTRVNPVNIGDNRWRIQPQRRGQPAVPEADDRSTSSASLAFYTKNSAFFTPKGYVTMTQNQTFGLEAHVAADLTPDLYVGASYYLAAIGERDVQSRPALPLSRSADPAQTVQTVRFTFGIRAEKATLLLLQYNQDIEESGGAARSARFIGARLSHAVFF